MKNPILILILTFTNISIFSQNFKEISSITRDEGEINQSRIKSFIYLNDNIGINDIKNNIYNFFDPQISFIPEDYKPLIDPTTFYTFFIYKKSNILNESFLPNDQDFINKPILKNHNNNIIAIVFYDIIDNSKEIIFYTNKIPTKRFSFNDEKAVNSTFIKSFGLENLLR